MKWKQTDTSKTIEEVVLRNTGYKDIVTFQNGSKAYYAIKFLREATDMIKEAIKNKVPITIVGDYDVDGISASSILFMAIKSLGGIVKVRLPRRISEGYGLSEKIVDEIDSGLLITVDNGIVAFDPIKKAKEKGLNVILTDHHLLDESGEVPCADIVIDPHIEGTADFTDYCGAGIAYRLAKCLITNEKLLNKLSCFAAIATICDMVPLVEENRLIVKKGLENLVTYGNRTSGLYSLLKCVDMDKIITETDIGFKIGPMINAAGRLYDDGAMKPFEILTYDGPFDEELGKELMDINDERKEKVQNAMEAIERNIQENCLYGEYPLVIYEPNIPEGIVGILAGKIVEEKNVPTFIFTDSEDPNVYKGSARSARGLHLKDLLDKCKSEDPSVFAKYGGHAEAAGVSVNASKFNDMICLLQENADEPDEVVENDTIFYDLEISANEVPDVIEQLKQYAPFGEGNPRIIFKINDYSLSPRYSDYYKVMGDSGQHIKLFSVNMNAIGFDMTSKYQDLGEPKQLNLVGTLGTNHYRNIQEFQIEIVDMISNEKKTPKTALAAMLAKRASERYS